MVNKRKNKRVGCFVPVESKPGEYFDLSQTLDFSKGGLGFISNCKIPQNTEVTIALDLAEDDFPALVVGKVRWARPVAGSDRYRIGLNFKQILFGSKSRLDRYFRKTRGE